MPNPGADDKIKMARAAGKALGLWLAVYFGLMHCFVIWKWQTPIDPTVSAAATTETVEAPLYTKADLEQLDAILLRLQTALAQHNEKDQLQADESQLQALSREFEVQEKRLQEITRTLDQASSAGGVKTPLKLKQLLSYPNLGALRSAAAVAKSISLAVAELNAVIEQKDWTSVAQFFESTDEQFPEYTAPAACSSSSTSRSSNLTPEQLRAAQDVIDATFSAQLAPHGLPLSFSETVEQIQETLQKAVANWTAAASTSSDSKPQKPVKSSHQQQVGCLSSTDHVISWVEAGMDAVHRKKDVRQALLAALQRDSVDTSSIILDADLVVQDDEQTTNQAAASTKVNLRQLLDTRSLHESAVYVDRFLDFIGGYHDGLDQALDQYVYNKVDNDNDDDDDEQVGKALAAALLQASGKINIPVPPVLQKK